MHKRFVRGETLNYRVIAPEYPASAGWQVTLYMNPRAGGTVVSVSGVADGDDHLLQATSTTTASWLAGWYSWEEWAAKGAEQYRIAGGQTEIVFGLVGVAAGFDTRTQAQIALDDAKAAFAAWTPTTRRYRIAGREMEFSDTTEIIRVVQYWENEVRREQAAEAMAAGRPNPRKLLVRLGRA